MDRAGELFARLSNDGADGVMDCIQRSEAENLYLDFKRSADNGVGKSLHRDDRRNLRAAISGFGSTAGGIILWGVDCRRRHDGSDTPIYSEDCLIADVNRFRSLIEAEVSGATLPPHDGVEVLAIPKVEASGFVAVLVRRCEGLPLRCLSDQVYYMRAGSSFAPIPHDLLAALFGRAPHASLDLVFSDVSAEFRNEDVVSLHFEMSCRNHGPGIAREVYVSANCHELPNQSGYIQFNQPMMDSRDRWQHVWRADRSVSHVLRAHNLPPSSSVRCLQWYVNLKANPTASLAVDITVGCESAVPHTTRIRLSAPECSALVSELLKAPKGDGNKSKEYLVGVLKTMGVFSGWLEL